MRTPNSHLVATGRGHMLPTVGRIVLWHPTHSGWQVVPAIVTHVGEEADFPGFVINMFAFVENGTMTTCSSEHGDQPGCWEWPRVESKPDGATGG